MQLVDTLNFNIKFDNNYTLWSSAIKQPLEIVSEIIKR